MAAWAATIIAVGAAVISWVYSRRSAAAAKVSGQAATRSAIAAERALHRQQTPVFEALVEDVGGDPAGSGGWPRLMRQLREPADLDEVRVELLSEGVSFPTGQNGVNPGIEVLQRTAVWTQDDVAPSPLRVGDRARWKVAFKHVEDPDASTPEQIELRVTAAAEGQSWIVLDEATVEAARKGREALESWRELQPRMRPSRK
ncbi:hypothetical protein [Catenuloplanes atrovinosus]|uniref:Uncharacterized protein n=1 Tax=Catenuloplanes atrovinosus TaxID=137266 RepID=A0AAE3YQV8_9ACTN|nr:hypothetical protein [Catenuloplanes atrovinosus]MDR7277582.1 hypothetical protein [Catenuloplanes atrovinosus]